MNSFHNLIMKKKEKTLYDGRLGFYNDERRSNLR